jgi:hypothetical protein
VVSRLLMRGMLAGIVAGVVAFGFARVVGEPQVDAAIAREAPHAHDQHDDGPVISRTLQRSAGLGTASLLYGVAIGGVFALVFALAHGRIGTYSIRATATVLGTVGLVAIHLAPAMKYPAEPPGFGDPDTVGRRTTLYLVLVAVSIAAAVVATLARRRLASRMGGRGATVVAAGGYIGTVALVGYLLPSVQYGDDEFPRDLLWRFRLASVGLQAVTWAAVTVAFTTLAASVYRSTSSTEPVRRG